jgi:hypothetical protein
MYGKVVVLSQHVCVHWLLVCGCLLGLAGCYGFVLNSGVLYA